MYSIQSYVITGLLSASLLVVSIATIYLVLIQWIKYGHIYGYTLTMPDREISIKDQILPIRENVETVYEKKVTPFGNRGKVDVAKKYIKKRVCVIVLRE